MGAHVTHRFLALTATLSTAATLVVEFSPEVEAMLPPHIAAPFAVVTLIASAYLRMEALRKQPAKPPEPEHGP